MKRNLVPVLVATAALLLVAEPALAQDPNSYKGYVAIGGGLGMGLAALGGALGQGMAAKAALEGIARNPGAQGKVLVPMVLGLALIESLVILAWLVTSGIANKV